MLLSLTHFFSTRLSMDSRYNLHASDDLIGWTRQLSQISRVILNAQKDKESAV